MSDQRVMYRGTKELYAEMMTLGSYNAFRGWPMPADENPNTPGYLVEYTDGGKPNVPGRAGYVSWSPKDVFERSYKPVAATPPQHLMTCVGGTTFALYADDQVEILRQDQPICRIPLADLTQFAREAGAA